VIVAESPESGKPIFPAQKERPTEAPFWVWKNGLADDDLKRIARNGFKKKGVQFFCEIITVDSF
jgi:hypothetical protein